jgi:hypothetical protein
MRSWALVGLALAGLMQGCAATVADACESEADCGGQVCLNAAFAPGGYCTKQCTVGRAESCPEGSTCVPDVIGKGMAGCLKACDKTKDDCRGGYTCRSANGSTQTVCVGPDGI